MDVDQDLIEEEKLLSGDQDINAIEQLNREKFIMMFKDKSNYPNENSIAVSDKLSWSRSKFFRIYDHYLEEREFSNDKRKNSRPPKRKLKDEYLMAIFEQLADKPEMKIPQMISFIKDNYNVELSRSTKKRSLIESDYRYIGTKIRPKNSIEEKIERNGEITNCIRIGILYSFQTKLLFILRIPLDLSGFIRMIKISQKLREEEEKTKYMGAISYKGKVSIEIFEENLNSDKYVQILSSKIEEMKMINNSNSILLQVDN